MFNIILLGITSLLTDISTEMVYPILPVYLVTTLGAGPAILGVIEGIAESTASLVKVFSGYFSDKIKFRKPFTILGYAASMFGKWVLYIAGSWSGVLLGRVLDRLGKGIRTAPRDALIAESAQAGRRGAAFGLHRTMDTLGAACGVAAAYFLLTRFQGNIRTIILFSLIPAFLGVAVLFFVRERKPRGAAGVKKLDLRWSSLDRRLRLFLIFSFIFTLGNSSNQFLLLRARDCGASLPRVLLFYLAFNIVYALTSYPAAKLSDAIGRKKILVVGYLCYGLVYLGFARNTSLHNFWILFGLYGIYMGASEGVEKALLADIAPAGVRATTIGLQATLVGIGLLPASLFAGLLWKFFGAAAPFYFGGVMGICSSIGLWFILRGV
jgi:MFS family permease